MCIHADQEIVGSREYEDVSDSSDQDGGGSFVAGNPADSETATAAASVGGGTLDKFDAESDRFNELDVSFAAFMGRIEGVLDRSGITDIGSRGLFLQAVANIRPHVQGTLRIASYIPGITEVLTATEAVKLITDILAITVENQMAAEFRGVDLTEELAVVQSAQRSQRASYANTLAGIVGAGQLN